MRAGSRPDDRAALVALSGLPSVGPGRLRALVGGRSPEEVWGRLRAGTCEVNPALAAACAGDRPADLLERWTAAARGLDVAAEWARHVDAGIAVLLPGDDRWPAALVEDPEPPAVLFARGDLELLDGRPAAAVVGTRRCSRYGWDVAYRLGGELAGAGITVVSGLASGIDGAAHRGVLDATGGAGPVGVVGTGLDTVYPRAHRGLWEEVAMTGVLVSESPLGTPPARWRFPARNRIIAALAGVTVVVESAAVGGALHTVDEAARRNRTVLAVPGPITSRASEGTNRLLADGAVPACDTGDILLALGAGGADVGVERADGAGAAAGSRRPVALIPGAPTGDGARLLEALGWQPATLDQLVLRSGLPLGTVARLATELEAAGWLAVDGGWYERRR